MLAQVGDNFGSEAIEGGERHLQMFFAGVFDFVVADAADGLDEHHYGRDTGAGDFGAVV
jgi:hypothetical protein